MNPHISIVCVSESSCLETIALRGVLEYFGYIPFVHWLGSEEQFHQIIEGKTSLEDLVLISGHGAEEGFYVYENKLVKIANITPKMKNKIVLSLGCVTGKESFAKAFLQGGAKAYIAPPGYPEGNSTMIFGLTFLWQFQLQGNVLKAWKEASKLLTDPDDRFRCYQTKADRILADGIEEIPLQ